MKPLFRTPLILLEGGFGFWGVGGAAADVRLAVSALALLVSLFRFMLLDFNEKPHLCRCLHISRAKMI